MPIFFFSNADTLVAVFHCTLGAVFHCLYVCSSIYSKDAIGYDPQLWVNSLQLVSKTEVVIVVNDPVPLGQQYDVISSKQMILCGQRLVVSAMGTAMGTSWEQQQWEQQWEHLNGNSKLFPFSAHFCVSLKQYCIQIWYKFMHRILFGDVFKFYKFLFWLSVFDHWPLLCVYLYKVMLLTDSQFQRQRNIGHKQNNCIWFYIFL